MKDELAGRLLGKLMDWDSAQLVASGGPLQTLARMKYDGYEGFRPGEKFLESLAGWLLPFEASQRDVLVQFVLDSLVYVSRPELDHLIDVVYPDIIRPRILAATAELLGEPPHLVAKLSATREFGCLQRSMLVLGLSDGARLDRLRRRSPLLSHEQFHPTSSLSPTVQDSTLAKLRLAVEDPTAQFSRLLLVEDFSGSGYSLLRCEDGTWGGKLWRANEEIERLVESGVVTAIHDVDVVVYIASEQARESLSLGLGQCSLPWSLSVVMPLGNIAIHDDEIRKIAEEWYDNALTTEHLEKGGRNPALGFAGAALPLVLYHNTPNNSISLLWGDTSERPGTLERRALFPREERHKASG